MKNTHAGAYPRKAFKGDTLYAHYMHRDVHLTLPLRPGGAARVRDELTAQMVRDGVITQAQKARCDAHICEAFNSPEKTAAFDDFSAIELYAHIDQLRCEALGEDALQREMDVAAARGNGFDLTGCLDQSALKDRLLQRADRVILALHEADFCPQVREDIARLQAMGKRVCLLCGKPYFDEWQLKKWLDCEHVTFLPADAALSEADGLLVYGEDGLLQPPAANAIVHAVPRGYYAQATVNQIGVIRPCLVYVPAHFDITRCIPITAKSRLSYWHLARLCENEGEGIYALSPETLYRRYPQYFINMYQSGPRCEEAQKGCPLRIDMPQEGEAFAQFDRARDEAIRAYLQNFDNIRYSTGYFYPEQQPGILVHAVRIRRARQSGVIDCQGETPRQVFKNNETGVVSNFLFFLTPKLAELYNDLRADRPREQASADKGHLDYKLCYEDGRRVETFPLYRKMCIACTKEGAYLFFNFRLGGGKIAVSGQEYRWEKEHVDATDGEVLVYTPYASTEAPDADRLTYRKIVGEGRVNLVILQDHIHCVRAGSVVLPSVGVVISLRKEAAASLLSQLPPLEDGYYDAEGLQLSVSLDAPEDVDPAVWRDVRWAYGGGLSLMQHGQALCDAADAEAWFAREGWMSPLSRQTQESALHVMQKHPRTAIGTTSDGDTVIMVFSGRTQFSSGADYNEMCRIARSMFPDIVTLMNVDGGASAVLGLVREGTFMELSYPATSADSCAGMVRPVKTLLYVSADK